MRRGPWLVAAGACVALLGCYRTVSAGNERWGMRSVDLAHELALDRADAVSLRGTVEGKTVILRCDCLPAPIRIWTYEGRFVIGGLPPGHYYAEIWRRGGSWPNRDWCEADLEAGERAVLDHGYTRELIWEYHPEFGVGGHRQEPDEVAIPCTFNEDPW